MIKKKTLADFERAWRYGIPLTDEERHRLETLILMLERDKANKPALKQLLKKKDQL